jgi:5-hydroxyisourate hydrolase
MSAITTHVLDTARGRPAAGIPVRLERRGEAGWEELGRGTTDGDGRCGALMPAAAALRPGAYRLRFAVAEHFAAAGTPAFYDRITVEFRVEEEAGHYHVPLLLGPYGYTTYRGS